MKRLLRAGGILTVALLCAVGVLPACGADSDAMDGSASAQDGTDAARLDGRGLIDDARGATNDAAVTNDAPGAVGDGSAPPGESFVSCSNPGTSCADSTTLVSCPGDGGAGISFTCTDGCNSAAPAHCNQSNLANGWTLYRFPLTDDDIQTQAAYSFTMNGLVATETENALPSAYVNNRTFESVRFDGRFSVQTTSDDDLIGFVFGWQDQEHFYLVDWKKGEQNDGTCGLASVGVSLKRVAGTTPSGDGGVTGLETCATFWASAGTPQVTVLSPASANPSPWVASVVYDFEITWRPGDIQITIKNGATTVASITSNDDTYPTGRLGFYNYSQADAQYEFVSVNAAP